MQKAHDELIDCTQEMERATAKVHSDLREYVGTRFRVGRASLARRLLWRTIFTYLSTRASSGDTEILQILHKADLQLLNFTSSHVVRWTTEAVRTDWAGYSEVSHQMRMKMCGAVSDEKRLLYPLLSRYD